MLFYIIKEHYFYLWVLIDPIVFQYEFNVSFLDAFVLMIMSTSIVFMHLPCLKSPNGVKVYEIVIRVLDQ